MGQKKVLIVSASIGTWHMQAAKAIEEHLLASDASLAIKHVDFLSQDTLSLDHIIKETYIKIIDIFPMFYELLYKLTKRDREGASVQTLVSWLLKNRMLKLIHKENPDILVFTHPFPCGAACILKRQHLIDVPIIGVITDFAVHQFWVHSQVDTYCVGSDLMVTDLMQNGVKRDAIVSTGMPIRSEYYKRPKRMYKAGEPLHALVMGGGLGLGDMKEVLDQLQEVEGIRSIDVVTGHNTSLYETLIDLRDSYTKKLSIYGYTREIPSLMAKASLLFTKPGGLTCQEAMAMGLPMIFFSAIPGQEEENALFFENMGCAKWAKDMNHFSELVLDLVKHREVLQTMSDASVPLCEMGAEAIGHVIHHWLEEKETEQGFERVMLRRQEA